jgi:hypothetical protein
MCGCRSESGLPASTPLQPISMCCLSCGAQAHMRHQVLSQGQHNPLMQLPAGYPGPSNCESGAPLTGSTHASVFGARKSYKSHLVRSRRGSTLVKAVCAS